MWLLGEKWPIQEDCSKIMFWYGCFGTHLIFEWCTFTWGICWLITVVFWYSPVTFLACIYEASDITTDHHIIKVSEKTSVNFSGTRLRPGYLGELLYWLSILLFTLEGSCTKKPQNNNKKPQKIKKQKTQQIVADWDEIGQCHDPVFVILEERIRKKKRSITSL